MVDTQHVDGDLRPGDARHMARALWHAERGRAGTSPNPVVGAVLVDADDVVVGVGHHQRAGGPHAEIVALQAAGVRAQGSTLYCTLEPCSHHGRTGPCCVAVADAGVARAVIATGDPFPQVAGRGIRYLRDRGVAVTIGLGRRDARRQNAPFFRVVERGRPWVHLKIAMGLDAGIAARPGERTAISGPDAARWTQRLRASVDAIAVGARTAAVDDPLLTARDVYRHRPLVRVVFDRQLRLSPDANLVRTVGDGPVVVITTEAGLASPRAATLRDRGLDLTATDGTVVDALRVLAARGLQSLLVEGGATLHAACWQAGVVDRVSEIVSGCALGPDAVRWNVPVRPHARATRVVPLGHDVLIDSDVHGID